MIQCASHYQAIIEMESLLFTQTGEYTQGKICNTQEDVRQTQTEKTPLFILHNCQCATTLNHKGIVCIIELFVFKELVLNLHLKFEYHLLISQASLLLLKQSFVHS